jgi:hypothetical protein
MIPQGNILVAIEEELHAYTSNTRSVRCDG